MKNASTLQLSEINQNQVTAYAEQVLETFWQDIEAQAAPDQWQQLNTGLTEQGRQYLNRALLFSHFMQKNLQNHVGDLIALVQMDSLHRSVRRSEFSQWLSTQQIQDEADLVSVLRHFRQQQMYRFIYRHFNRLSDTTELIAELSDFADACIIFTRNWHHARLIERFGQPLSETAQKPQSMVVLAMGKLGARELNLSSDIDLIFAYGKAGFTQGPDIISNQEFFSLLGQRLIKTLNQKTCDGFVFRVDMRLRPFGQSGLLVNRFKALENYYQYQGREWERYAMVKARALPNSITGRQLQRLLRPFVYRRYTDFSAIEALREMKQLINKEVRRLGKQQDIKLGAGGIREIEFIAQVYQLIYGGKQLQLQQRQLLSVLKTLQSMQLMSASAVSELTAAYLFLRDTEHCLQGVDDRQTHRLPKDEDAQKLLALAMGFDSWFEFMGRLNAHSQNVRHYFDSLIEKPEALDNRFAFPFDVSALADGNFTDWLLSKGFNDDEVGQLLDFKNNTRHISLSVDVKYKIRVCLQGLLLLLADRDDRQDAVAHIVRLLEAIVRRSIYLVFLIENPDAMKRLVTIACISPWVMQQLSRYPSLLDELLDVKAFGFISDVDDIADSLQQHALRIPEDDLEEQMDMLRYFKIALQANVTVAELSGELPLFRVSDYLSHLAEAILSHTLELAWTEMADKYGYPTQQGKPYERPPFAIIAYGKLGGIELSYNSDLDLVFLYDAPLQEMTDGQRAITNPEFFARMGQRIIHILSTRTQLGQLYEVDMRLRPSGNKGLLVSSIQRFENYQRQQAWTWERQALVRARAVAGSLPMTKIFNDLRFDILTQQRSRAELAREVLEMREKMFAHLTPAYAKADDSTIFDLKHSRWGIVDIEFMVQFAVLAFAHRFTELVAFTDNIRILEIMADNGLITDHERRGLVDAYQSYRSLGHNLALRQEKNEVSACKFQQERQVVKKVWRKLILSTDYQ